MVHGEGRAWGWEVVGLAGRKKEESSGSMHIGTYLRNTSSGKVIAAVLCSLLSMLMASMCSGIVRFLGPPSVDVGRGIRVELKLPSVAVPTLYR
jgi:hypothetical protein